MADMEVDLLDIYTKLSMGPVLYGHSSHGNGHEENTVN